MTAPLLKFINYRDVRAKIKAEEKELANPPEWLSQADICRRYNISRSTLNRRRKDDPNFPQPSDHMGKRSLRWNASQLYFYMITGKNSNDSSQK